MCLREIRSIWPWPRNYSFHFLRCSYLSKICGEREKEKKKTSVTVITSNEYKTFVGVWQARTHFFFEVTGEGKQY